MKKTAAICFITVTLLAPVVNASVPVTQQQPESKPQVDKGRLFRKAGIGCVVGSAFAFLTKNKDKALVGCAAGAAVGGFMSYREQMKEAREVAEQAKRAGLDTRIDTKTVHDEKTGESTEAMTALVIKYNPADMERMDDATSKTLDKVATLAKKSKNQLTFTFTGKRACSIPMDALNAREAFAGHIVKDRCGSGESAIVITPMPEV